MAWKTSEITHYRGYLWNRGHIISCRFQSNRVQCRVYEHDRKVAGNAIALIAIKIYLYFLEDRIKISLDCIRWKSADKCSKRWFFWKRFITSISASTTTEATTPSPSTVRRAIFPWRNRFRAVLHSWRKNETESKSIHLLPWPIAKIIVKSSTAAASIEVVRHVGRTEHQSTDHNCF